MGAGNAYQVQSELERLQRSVIRNKPESVRKILTSKPHYANYLYNGDSLLHYPCRHGNLEMVKLLLELRVDVNIKNRCGVPPIINAIAH